MFNSTLLLLGLIKCEFPTALKCRLFRTVVSLGKCYREVFIVLYLRAICKLWDLHPQGQGISYLSYYSYALYAVLLSPYVATTHVHSWDLNWGNDVLN